MLAMLDDVTKVYGKSYGLRDLTLEIPVGQVIGLLGVNGSGKTTLLKLLSGLLLPTRGRVSVLGESPRRNRAKLVFLGETDAIYRWTSPTDAERLMSGLYPDFSLQCYRTLLDSLQIPMRRAGAMSKGERARLRLAMALAREASLYILDEPLGGIDLVSRERILQSIVGQWRADASIILSTHAVAEAEGLFDRVVFLREGILALDALAEELRERGESVRSTFLEVLG
ncbi:MAG TPA: ABC transporter ATP-binding protein [Candidatus Acetothermia bacterium]|nr:ABC transporter ATP-binding protein [Candidatus Acetothermia bacterium]